MTRRRRPAGWPVALLSAVALVALAGCAAGSGDVGVPPAASAEPSTTVSPGVGLTRAELVTALGAHNLVLTDSPDPVRPAEAPILTQAPRAVFKVLLPQDPSHGYIVVYELPDNAHAADAAAQEQAYLGTGIGRVQTPQGTVYVLRQLGNTVILYSWLPGASTDPSAPGIQAALETVGVPFQVPT